MVDITRFGKLSMKGLALVSSGGALLPLLEETVDKCRPRASTSSARAVLFVKLKDFFRSPLSKGESFFVDSNSQTYGSPVTDENPLEP